MNFRQNTGGANFSGPLINSISNYIRYLRFAMVAVCALTAMSIASPSFSQESDDSDDSDEIEETEEAVANKVQSTWVLQNPVDKVVVDLAPILNKRQLKLLNSGISTFSQLTLSYTPDSGDTMELYQVSCTVKYDTWEEQYELARLDERPQVAVVKKLEKYLDLCLTAEIVSQAAIAHLADGNGEVVVHLQIEQISASQANDIRKWLIKQQSGVIQGLFSHMLGEFTLSESVNIEIPVPPKPTTPTSKQANKQNQ